MSEFKNRIFLFIGFLMASVMSMFLSSCYSPVEGCTDPESTNYAISADELCEDCCEYPEFKLSIFHENKDTTFNLRDTITNDLEQQISLLDFVYLLSDFEIKVGEEVYSVSDSLSLNVENGVEYVKDDIIRVTRDVFTFELGTIIFDGNTTEFTFRTGLTDLLNENRFTEEIDGHPLTTDPDSLYQSNTDTYIFQRIQVAQGADFSDTVVYNINRSSEVTFSFEFESVRGTDKTLIIEAQYDKWFDGVDFSTMSKEEIEEKITLNSSNVFRQKN